MKKYTILVVFLTITINSLLAQKYTISGYIKDQNTGEELIGANVYVKELKTGVVANFYGFYSVTLPVGTYHFVYSFIGYDNVEKELKITKSEMLTVELPVASKTLDVVEVTGERRDKNIKAIEMSTNKLQMKSIKTIPVLFGEVDVLKTIQLLPGVSSGAEGSTGFHVRGGSADQNLILLDGAPVYNASHAGGIFSVFNGDAIKDMKLYKGGIPAEYGGRLASVLDIRMKEGNSKRFAGSGGIGLISSRLSIEGPIIKDKSSFVLNGRRTYLDLFFPLAKDTLLHDVKTYFHDFNAKINYTINDKNKIYLSGYFGRDVLQPMPSFRMDYGNTTGTVRMNHIFSEKIFSNFMFIYSNFDYKLSSPEGVMAFDWTSNIIDYSLKNNYNFFLNPKNTLKFGWGVTLHKFKPGVMKPMGNSQFQPITLENKHALEYIGFVSNEQKFTANFSLQYGLRYSVFQNIGPATEFKFAYNNELDKYKVTDAIKHSKYEIYNTYMALLPRLGARYTINENSSVKASYNRTTQYIHLASNTTIATPIDIYFSSSPNVKPQYANQVAAGYFRNFLSHTLEASIEVYYKKMNNSIDFRNHAELFLNDTLEREFRYGSAYSYGLEFLLRKNIGQFTGWISYTLSKTMREIKAIKDEPYFAPYDKPHDVSIVASYNLTKYINVSSTWVYSTALPRTLPTGKFTYQGKVIPIYSDRNNIRLPNTDYHRLDFACTIYSKKAEDRKRKKRWKNFESSWTFSVYNLYARKNPFSITFIEDENDPTKMQAQMVYLFKVLPSVSWNFKF